MRICQKNLTVGAVSTPLLSVLQQTTFLGHNGKLRMWSQASSMRLHCDSVFPCLDYYFFRGRKKAFCVCFCILRTWLVLLSITFLMLSTQLTLYTVTFY